MVALGVEIAEAPTAETDVVIAFVVIPEDPFAAVIAGGSKFFKTFLAVDLLMEKVFPPRLYGTAAVFTDMIAHVHYLL